MKTFVLRLITANIIFFVIFLTMLCSASKTSIPENKDKSDTAVSKDNDISKDNPFEPYKNDLASAEISKAQENCSTIAKKVMDQGDDSVSYTDKVNCCNDIGYKKFIYFHGLMKKYMSDFYNKEYSKLFAKYEELYSRFERLGNMISEVNTKGCDKEFAYYFRGKGKSVFPGIAKWSKKAIKRIAIKDSKRKEKEI